jgi:hypothetical protein
MSKTKLIHYVPSDVILPVENYLIEDDGKSVTIASNYKSTLEGAKTAYEQDPLANIFALRPNGTGLIGFTFEQAKELIQSLQSMVDYVVPPVVIPPVTEPEEDDSEEEPVDTETP